MPSSHPTPTFDPRAATGLAVAVLLIHIATNILTPYELHRDEFLYLAMGQHLRLWHMDFPPFIAIVGRLSQALFDTSIPGLRLTPALSHAALVYSAAWTTAAFEGRRSAQMLAALAVATSPLFLRAGNLFQPVPFDQLWWTLALIALIVRIRTNDPRHWLTLGTLLGLGTLTKFSIAFLALGLAAGVLATPLRRDLLTRWPWMAVIIATVLGHPSITGQIQLGWPLRAQMADLQAEQLVHVGPLAFLTGQLGNGPIVLLALLGAGWLLRSHRRAPASFTPPSSGSRTTPPAAPTPPDFRPVAIATITAFLVLLLLRGKPYYIGPIYPVLAAAGAVALDELGRRWAPERPTKPLAIAAAIVALYGVLMLPLGLPLLAPPDMERYTELLGAESATVTNTGEQLALPQDYADMLGWTALADTVARVWHDVPPADTASTILLATNYGRAGALDVLGKGRGLPAAIAPVGSYWFFGPGSKSGLVAVVVGETAETLHKFYRDVTEVAHTSNPWGVPEEQTVHIWLCRGAFRPIAEVWPSLAGQN